VESRCVLPRALRSSSSSDDFAGDERVCVLLLRAELLRLSEKILSICRFAAGSLLGVAAAVPCRSPAWPPFWLPVDLAEPALPSSRFFGCMVALRASCACCLWLF